MTSNSISTTYTCYSIVQHVLITLRIVSLRERTLLQRKHYSHGACGENVNLVGSLQSADPEHAEAETADGVTPVNPHSLSPGHFVLLPLYKGASVQA